MIPDEIQLPGRITATRLIASRRGSRVWRLSLADGPDVALKYTTRSQNLANHTPRLAAREAAVRAILDPASVYAHGASPAGTWLAVTWHDAKALNKPWRRLRRETTPSTRAGALASTLSAGQALAALHKQGWRHADVQADHILIPEVGPARLVDLALAQGPTPVRPDVTYRGALAHLTAPEVAAEILATPAAHHVTLTATAEVYMFGAVVFAAWAGTWPYDYGADAVQPSVAHIHAVIADRRSLRPMPEGWPALAQLVTAMLAPAPGDRPTMADVVAAVARAQAAETS
jgi:hypothetical protein